MGETLYGSPILSNMLWRREVRVRDAKVYASVLLAPTHETQEPGEMMPMNSDSGAATLKAWMCFCEWGIREVEHRMLKERNSPVAHSQDPQGARSCFRR